MRILYLTEEESESILNRNKAEDSVDHDLCNYEQPLFQNLESFLRTMRVEDETNFILQKQNFIFRTKEIQPGKYEVSDIDNSQDNLVKANFSSNLDKKKSHLKTKTYLRFIKTSFFNTVLELTPLLHLKPKIEFVS